MEWLDWLWTLAILGTSVGTVSFFYATYLDTKLDKLQTELNKLKKDKEND